MRLMAVAEAKPLITEILRGLDASSRGADPATTHLADANPAHDSSHGMQMLPFPVTDWRDGRLRPTSQVTTVHSADAVAVMDGNSGLGKRHKKRGRRSRWFTGCDGRRVDGRTSCPHTVSNRLKESEERMIVINDLEWSEVGRPGY